METGIRIEDRSRKKQMDLADKFKIQYPSPGGGCFLCEKDPAKRLKVLLEKNLINEDTLPLTLIRRHFWINDTWFVVERSKMENMTIKNYQKVI